MGSAEFVAVSVVILLFSVILHEIAHGYVALKFGDRTALLAGRLTFNPLVHIDPIGTILVPIVLLLLPLIAGVTPSFFIAWAKPVPVNPYNFKDIARGEFFVSIAGVGANFCLAIFGAMLYHLNNLLLGNVFLSEVFWFMVGINLMLGVFNLLPIPPLDGSKVLMSMLPVNIASQYARVGNYGILIFLVLMYFGVLGKILTLTLYPLFSLLGVPAF